MFLTFKDENQDFSSGLKSYVYVDDLDRRIMEMALQVVGVQMNGRQENATEIAKRIVGQYSGHFFMTRFGLASGLCCVLIGS